jgi:hypothetical protein
MVSRHVKFRDAVGHAEPDQSSTLEQEKPEQPRRFGGRQKYLEGTTFADAYSRLQEKKK